MKQQGQQFYNNQVESSPPSNSPHVLEINKMEEWDTLVGKSPVPVVLQCYATWCQPCKQLAPVLEEMANKAQGSWVLIKMDIDRFGQIAQALKIKSVPTLYLIHNGNAVDGLAGMPNEQ